jgi:hypothetical protein
LLEGASSSLEMNRAVSGDRALILIRGVAQEAAHSVFRSRY